MHVYCGRGTCQSAHIYFRALKLVALLCQATTITSRQRLDEKQLAADFGLRQDWSQTKPGNMSRLNTGGLASAHRCMKASSCDLMGLGKAYVKPSLGMAQPLVSQNGFWCR